MDRKETGIVVTVVENRTIVASLQNGLSHLISQHYSTSHASRHPNSHHPRPLIARRHHHLGMVRDSSI